MHDFKKIKIVTSVYKSVSRNLQWLTFICLMFSSSMALSAVFVPLGGSGSVSYTYGWSKSQNIENSRQSLTLNMSGAAYIWRPWFISVMGGASFGLYKSVSTASSTKNSSTVWSGNLGFRVFPQSRFPFSLTASFTDSRLENNNAQSVGTTQFTNFQIAATQSYFARNGSFTFFTWRHNEFKSQDNNYNSDSINAYYNKRRDKQSLSVSGAYNTSESDTNSIKPESISVSLSHSYIPGATSRVNSLASHSITDPDTNTSDNDSNVSQASSVFTWQPTHRPYSFSGAALVNRSESNRPGADKTSTVGLSLQLGGSYRFSRRWRMYGNLSGGVSESDRSTVTRANANITSSYASEQYIVGGFSYSFGFGMGIGAGYADSELKEKDSTLPEDQQDVNTDSQTGSMSFSHSAARSWVVGRASSWNLNFGQNLSGSVSSVDTDPTYGFGHSISTGWSTRHLRGSTYASATLSDSRTFSNVDNEFQQLTFDLTHTRSLSRVSAMNANIALGASRQVQIDTEEVESTTNYFRFLTSYRNSRLFGIYPLRFLMRISYSATELQEQNSLDNSTVKGDARFSYHIGLLSTSLTFDAQYNLVGTSTFGATFQISRAF